MILLYWDIILHISGYLRNSDSEKGSLLLSEVIFSIGDVLNYINTRAFEQVGEFVGQVRLTGENYQNVPKLQNLSQRCIDPDLFLSSIESVELLLESLAEWYSMKVGKKGQVIKWAVVVTIQMLK